MTTWRTASATLALGGLGFANACSSPPNGPDPTQGTNGVLNDSGARGDDSGARADDSMPSGEDEKDGPPLHDDAAIVTGDGGLAQPPAEGGSNAADAIADSSAGAGDDSAGTAVYYGPPRPPPLCSVSLVWRPGTRLDVSTPLDDAFAAITPDELSIAWTAGTGQAAMIYYADRAANTDPFGVGQGLSASAFAADRVALSPDGLRLVVVNQDRQGFSELSRAVRNAAFGGIVIGSYSGLDALGVLAAGEVFGDPVLSEDDHIFFYSVYGAAGQARSFARYASSTEMLGRWVFRFGRPGICLHKPLCDEDRRPSLSISKRSSFGTRSLAWSEPAG